MMRKVRPDTSTLLFGAFDRHNFGDLLFPHIVAALLPQQAPLFGGLAARDMRHYGGHQTRAVAQLAATWGGRPLNILHVGGELLTCDTWQAAIMLLPPENAPAIIAHLDRHPEARLAWAQRQLGYTALAPYTLQRRLFPGATGVTYNAVGGIALDEVDKTLRNEVLANLRAADAVSVRERTTLSHLLAAGIAARLTPDPVVMVAELFGERIRRRSCRGEVGRIQHSFPQGYIAVQFSADFGDDATLRVLAAQLDQTATATGLGVVFFRAGAAPWHDDLQVYRRVASYMQETSPLLFASLNIWDICALIAHSSVYCGSSLHGRIVAMAFALPRINLQHPVQGNHPGKQAAFAATWEEPGVPSTAGIHEVANGIYLALSIDVGRLQKTAETLAVRYRLDFADIRQVLG